MMPRLKMLSCLTLLVLIILLSTARSDVPNCDGTEAVNQFCPLDVKRCDTDCDLPCSQESCYETVGNPRAAPFSCRDIQPRPEVFTTKCVAMFWPPPPVGPPAPVMADCFDAKRCEVDVEGCRPNPDSQFTMQAPIYTRIDSPDCAKSK